MYIAGYVPISFVRWAGFHFNSC